MRKTDEKRFIASKFAIKDYTEATIIAQREKNKSLRYLSHTNLVDHYETYEEDE
jgi:hypothetical protein